MLRKQSINPANPIQSLIGWLAGWLALGTPASKQVYRSVIYRLARSVAAPLRRDRSIGALLRAARPIGLTPLCFAIGEMERVMGKIIKWGKSKAGYGYLVEEVDNIADVNGE